MNTYLHIQEGQLTTGVLPWAVTAKVEDAVITTPSSMLGMVRVVGFQKDPDVQQVDLWWGDAVADPSKAEELIKGMYVVTRKEDGNYQQGTSPVVSVEVWEVEHEIPVEKP